MALTAEPEFRVDPDTGEMTPVEWDATIPDTMDASVFDAALLKRADMLGFLRRRQLRLDMVLNTLQMEHDRRVARAMRDYEAETASCADAFGRLTAALNERARDYRKLTGKTSVRTMGFGTIKIGKPSTKVTWPEGAEGERRLIAALKDAGHVEYIRTRTIPETVKETVDKATLKEALLGPVPLLIELPGVDIVESPGDVEIVDETDEDVA